MIEYVTTMRDNYDEMVKKFPEYYIEIHNNIIYVYTKKWFGKRIGMMPNQDDYALYTNNKALAEKFNSMYSKLKVKLYHPDINL
jgi:hypothetical protein